MSTDYNNNNKNIELIQFLNQEKVNKKVNNKKIFLYYNKCLLKSIIDLNNKLSNIENKSIYLENGVNMIYHIFFTLILYTNNIKLTIFLLERAILFYSEFIIMSKNQNLIDKICFIPNINDALTFTYKKTIGPIKIKDIKKNEIKDLCYIINTIYKDILARNESKKYLDFINIIHSEICNIIFDIYISIEDNIKKNKINLLINEIIDKDYDFVKKISMLKLFLLILKNNLDKDIIFFNNILQTISINHNKLDDCKINNIKDYEIYKILTNNNDI